MISGDKQRILRLNNPINGAKIELTRFETRSDSTQTMPRKLNFFCHYDFRKFRLKSVGFRNGKEENYIPRITCKCLQTSYFLTTWNFHQSLLYFLHLENGEFPDNPDWHSKVKTLILVTLKTEYAMFGTSCSITSSLHLNPKEKINNLSIRLPILQSWRDAIRADKAFTSITCEFTVYSISWQYFKF